MGEGEVGENETNKEKHQLVLLIYVFNGCFLFVT